MNSIIIILLLPILIVAWSFIGTLLLSWGNILGKGNILENINDMKQFSLKQKVFVCFIGGPIITGIFLLESIRIDFFIEKICNIIEYIFDKLS